MREQQVTVLIGSEGRHLFETIRNPQIRIVTSFDDAADPHLIVFPCGQDRRFENVSSAPLLHQMRMRVPLGSIGIVFDGSTEGVPHKPDITASLHTVLNLLGTSPLNCVYITQDRNYEADYRLHCDAVGLDRRVAILNHDYWIWHTLKQFEGDAQRVYEERVESFRSRPCRRQRRFISLNRTPRPTKILFLLSLLRDGLWNEGFISFGGFGKPGGPGKPRPSAEQLVRALPGFQDKIAELMPLLDVLEKYGRVLFGLERHGWKRLELWNASLAVELAEYGESWFSVVTETEMRSRPSRITEKVIKPLVNFHPLLVFGNPGSLKMIRSFGFTTFEEIFDESYDEEPDPRKRFDLVYAEVTRMCRLEDDELRTLEEAITEKLLFNAHWGIVRFAELCRAERDAALVNDILTAVSRGRGPAPESAR